MSNEKFTWNEESTAAAVAAYQDAIATQGCEIANSDETLNAIAVEVGAKNANSIRRKLVLEKAYQKIEKPTAKKAEAKGVDPLAWDDDKLAQAKELYEAKVAKDGIAAANDTEWLNSIASTIGVKGSKAIVGKLAVAGVYQKADTPRSIGGAKRVPKPVTIRAMAIKLERLGYTDALEKLEPLEVANTNVITFLAEVIEKFSASVTAE